MVAKKSHLCWDDIDDLDSRTLAEWGAFRLPHVETVELNGHHTKSATFMMAANGFSFELTYFWEDEGDETAIFSAAWRPLIAERTLVTTWV